MVNLYRNYKKTRRLAGFTLVELMTVLMIIAAMTVVIAPYASRSNDGLRMKQESSTIAEAIRYISDMAVETQRATRIIINPKKKSFFLEMADEDNKHNFQAIEQFDNNGAHYFGLDIRIIDIEGFDFEGNGYSLEFNPEKPWPNGRISISLDNLISTIIVRGKITEITHSEI